MMPFKIRPLVLAVAVATPAFAQDTNTAAEPNGRILEEVVVTGSYRESLANALGAKRDSAAAVDAIMAEDIADFPDNNLAESLQRIPGVAISRSGGEGRNITVRGLGPAFTRVRLNGMETISTTGGTDAVGGNNRGRGFDFNTFSSDLFSSLVVRKTSSAEVEEGSLGATVDLKAAQPFDFDELVFTASTQLGYNDLSEEVDPGAAFLVSNTFADSRFGALLSMSYSERTVQDEGSSTVRWSRAPNQAFGNYLGEAIDSTHPVNTAFRPRIPRYDSYLHEMERLGVSTSLQFRPAETTVISLDILYALHDATRQEIFLQGSLNPGSNATANILDYEIRGETLVYASMEGARLLSENRFDEMSNDFLQTTLTAEHEFSDRWRARALLGSAESKYDNPIQNTLLMQANDQNFSFDYRNGRDAILSFGDGAYDPASWVATGVRQRPQSTTNQFDTLQLSSEFDASDAITLKGGLEYKEFTFNTDQFAYASEGANGVDIQSNPDFITQYDAGLGDGRPWLVPDRAKIMTAYGLFDLPLQPNRGNTFSAEEETTGIYLQLDFATEIGPMPVRGDIGVRHFKTDQSSTGYVTGAETPTLTTVDHDYSDTLPSLNVVFEPIDNLLVRLGFSEGISRAGLTQITPSSSVSVAGTNLTVNGNNPFLEPTKATSYDLGFEWYFSDEGMVNLAFFRKEIDSHIQTLRSQPIFTEIAADLGIPVQAAIDACTNQGAALGGYGDACNENLPWNYSVPRNGPGGDLDGFELSYQQPFTFLPEYLEGFGFIGSYTQVESDMDYLAVTGEVTATRPLINLSKYTSSATIYYENDVFSARVSVAKRSGYLTTPIGRDGNDMEGTKGTTNVDAVLAYQITDELKVSVEALNLTDEVDDQWVGSQDDRLSYYHATGRQYYLGLKYKY